MSTEKSKVTAPVAAAAAPMFFSCGACTYRNKGTAKCMISLHVNPKSLWHFYIDEMSMMVVI
jgi:hypothetical protein